MHSSIFKVSGDEREFLRALKFLKKKVFDDDVSGLNLIPWIGTVQDISSHLNIEIPIIIGEGDKKSVYNLNIFDEASLKGVLLEVIERQVNSFLLKLESRVTLFEAYFSDNDVINLDDDWKTRATSYVSHIREVVAKAEIEEGIRERVFACLNILQAEIDRNRTRLETLSDVFLKICDAINKGSKNLSPAVRLFERLAGALYGIRNSEIENPTPRLPPPDQSNLPAPEDFDLR